MMISINRIVLKSSTMRRINLAIVASFVGLNIASCSSPTVKKSVTPISDEYGQAALTGAGSTFVYPLVSAWADVYNHQRLGGVNTKTPNAGLDDTMTVRSLDYESVGSLAGMQRLSSSSVDFAISEMPLSPSELQRHGWQQRALTVGGVAIVANIPELGQTQLKLDGETLAGIYQGTIKQWNHPNIVALNTGAPLPAKPIQPIYRADGSGTTYTLSAYLDKVSPNWRSQMGRDLQLKWQVGKGYQGSTELVKAVSTTPHSIGYVNDTQAKTANLAMIAIKNAQGQFVLPNPTTVMAATTAAPTEEGLLVNANANQAYPIVATAYALIPTGNSLRAKRANEFVDWAVTQGQTQVKRLGYVPLNIKK